MRALRLVPIPLLLALLPSPALGLTVHLAPARAVVRELKLRPKAAPPKTDYTKLDKAGPVRSSDPYFTLTLGEAEIYRDALDHTLAYYRPILRLGKRTGTPLAAGVGDLAADLDGFLFRYYKFESGGSPKWADMQLVIVAERPEEATLENVQERWRDVTRLIPLPFELEAADGVRMSIPYPPRSATFSQLEASGGDDDLRWYHFSTNTHPAPPDLLTDEDNNTLNETKARDFTALITSDLSDMPSFQPTLRIRAVYPGWQGASPLLRTIIKAMPRTLLQTLPQKTAPAGSMAPARIHPGTIVIPRQLSPEPIRPAPELSPTIRVRRAPLTIQPSATIFARPALIRPDLIRVIGALKPRDDVDYTYSETQSVLVQLPITYAKETTPYYDYYFLSDSGRFGGPYFEPSSQPDRPQRADPPEAFSGYWYESHFFGKRLVWPAPRALRLAWADESGLRPSCRFSVTLGEEDRLTAHISYDLYPDFSMRPLSAAVADLSLRTGETIDLLPFTDVLDANQIQLESGNQTVQDLITEGRLSITKLSPQDIGDAWFRVAVDMPIDDWAAFTLFMKLGELGSWDCGVLTGATSGMAEKLTFQLDGDLLQTMGGPVVPSVESYDPDSGGYEVVVDNYGLQSLEIEGLRFLLTGDEQTSADVWLDGQEVPLPGVGSASSFDQSEGASGSVAATITMPDSPDLKALMDSGDYQDLGVALTNDMIGPSTAPEDVGGIDPDILFSFLRSLCYQYIGSSEIIQIPVAPAELSQWLDYRSGTIVLRFQGFVYTRELDLSGTNRVDVRRLPREGAYASSGRPGDADLLEYRATFAKNVGTVVHLPAQTEGESRWLTGDITGINLDMTQAQ